MNFRTDDAETDEQQASVSGVIPLISTAFNEDEELNVEATSTHAPFVVNRGVHSVFPLGTNWEFPMRKPDEHANVVDRVVDEVGDMDQSSRT